MSWHRALGIAGGIIVGLGLGILPLLQYGGRSHSHVHPSDVRVAPEPQHDSARHHP